MKQLLITSFIMYGCLGIQAQSGRYSAYSVAGKVQVQQEATWKDVTRRMSLGAFDELNISEKGSLKVLENKTNRIYKSSGSGTMTVHQLVKNAKAQSERSLYSLTGAFTKSMGTQIDNSYRLHALGAAHRGSSSDVSFEDSICSSIAYTANLLIASEIQLEDSSVIGKRIINEDTYTISIENLSDLAYCINLVSVNMKENTCRLLLSPGYDGNTPYIILDSKTKANLDNICYLNNPDERLFVFASDCLFDNEEVKAMLEDYQIENGKELFKMQYFEIK